MICINNSYVQILLLTKDYYLLSEITYIKQIIRII